MRRRRRLVRVRRGGGVGAERAAPAGERRHRRPKQPHGPEGAPRAQPLPLSCLYNPAANSVCERRLRPSSYATHTSHPTQSSIPADFLPGSVWGRLSRGSQRVRIRCARVKESPARRSCQRHSELSPPRLLSSSRPCAAARSLAQSMCFRGVARRGGRLHIRRRRSGLPLHPQRRPPPAQPAAAIRCERCAGPGERERVRRRGRFHHGCRGRRTVHGARAARQAAARGGGSCGGGVGAAGRLPLGVGVWGGGRVHDCWGRPVGPGRAEGDPKGQGAPGERERALTCRCGAFRALCFPRGLIFPSADA